MLTRIGATPSATSAISDGANQIAADLKEQYEHNVRMREMVAEVGRVANRVRQARTNARSGKGGDAAKINPETIMPSYYRTEGLHRVGWQWQGQPVLSAQQIEDVVAFLRTLRDKP